MVNQRQLNSTMVKKHLRKTPIDLTSQDKEQTTFWSQKKEEQTTYKKSVDISYTLAIYV